MTDVKNSRLYKTLKKAVRKEDHAELLRMLEMVPEASYEGARWKGFESDSLWNAFAWLATPQREWWSELYQRIENWRSEQ
jgi:hypothetical protein